MTRTRKEVKQAQVSGADQKRGALTSDEDDGKPVYSPICFLFEARRVDAGFEAVSALACSSSS